MKEKWPFVSIIMTSLNGKKWLEPYFESVLKTSYPHFEVIFVDGGSTDGSVEFVKHRYGQDARVRIFQETKNTGWSGGNNAGIRRAAGDIFALISSDVQVEPDWLSEVVKVFETDPRVGIVQLNMHRLNKKDAIDSGMNYLDRFGYSYSFYPNSEPTKVFFAEGMAFAFRRELVRKIGLLDEYFFMEYDDMDFSWRARLAGYQVVFVPSAIAYHARGGQAGASYFERRPRNHTQYLRNHLVTLVKNYELKNLVITFPVTFVIESAKVLYFTLSGNFSFANATARGFVEFFRDIPLILEKRRETQRIRTVKDRAVMKYMAPFRPQHLFAFLTYEKKKERYIIPAQPPIKER